MSSSEEYLDNLLKSMMEGSSAGSTEDTPEETDTESVQAVMDETNMPEKVAVSDMNMPEQIMINDGDMPEESMDEIGMPDLSTASADSDANKAMTMEEIEDMLASMGSLSTEKTIEEAAPEETAAEEYEADPDLMAILDGFGQDSDALAIEEPLEDTSMEMPLLGESQDKNPGLEDMELSDFGLDDFDLEETDSYTEHESDDSVRDNALENLLADGGDQSDVSLDDISLDDLSLEEPSLDDMEMDAGDMSEADIDRLLGGEMPMNDSSDRDELSLDDSTMPDDLALTDDFALEDYGEEDADLSALLAGMEHDKDLSEINDLLEKSDQGVSVDDDDMLAMLENIPEGESDENSSNEFDFFGSDEAVAEADSIRELTQEELQDREEDKKINKEKKKKEKKEKKGRKAKGAVKGETVDGAEETATLESLLGAADAEETPKKQGVFARFLAFLLEEDEEEEAAIDNADGDSGLDDLPIGNPSDENKQLLEELSEEDKKNAKKKGKKGKKKKDKKGKKSSEDLEEGEELEEEVKSKRKSKKAKKKKKENNPEEEELKEPEKKLSKKKVIPVFLFCATMAACIVVLATLLPSYVQKRDARVAYDYQKYDVVYDLLYGKKLNEEDELLLKKSSIIMQMERKLDSYENYEKLDMPLEALDALISGVDRYHTILPKAEQYNVVSEVNDIYDQILEKLSGYGISETDALDIISSGDDVTYSQRLENIVYGYGVSMESTAEPIQDVLPEEEEIIERLESLGEAETTDDDSTYMIDEAETEQE